MLSDGLVSSDAQAKPFPKRWIFGSLLAVAFLVIGFNAAQQRRTLELAAQSASAVMTDSARFERLQHFKDVGVPATTKNPLARATIAYATCLLFHVYPAALFNVWNKDATDAILGSLSSLPTSDNPSWMTLTAKKAMPSTCSNWGAGGVNDLDAFGFDDVYGNVDNWHHALCAGEDDPSWGGHYDPAYQPQQQALTLGLACSFICPLADKASIVSTTFLDQLTRVSPSPAVDAYCQALPWGEGWKSAKSLADLKAIATPLSGSVCGCEIQKKFSK